MENKDYTLLVVDDVSENRDMLSRRLQRRDFKVLTAKCGERALEIVRGQAVDLVTASVCRYTTATPRRAGSACRSSAPRPFESAAHVP